MKKKPQILDTDEGDLKYLEREVLGNATFAVDQARKSGEKYLKKKFFPPEMRGKLWVALLENKHKLNPKLYKYYADLVEKKFTDNEHFGRVCVTEQDTHR